MTMSSLDPHLDDARALLGRLFDEIDGLPAGLWSEGHDAAGLASPGAHVRHLLDAYDNLLHGWCTARVDYDQRARDARTEQDPRAALVRIAALRERLLELRGSEDRPLRTRSDAPEGTADDAWWTTSTRGRELNACLGHAIHHCALIGARLRLAGHDPVAGFGIAPSTLRHLARTEAASTPAEDRAPCAR